MDAHEQIRQVTARYAHGVDRLDEATMKSAYWPEAIDDHGVYVGNAMPFCERVVRTHTRFLMTMHCNLNHLIELTSDTTATGEIYNVTYMHSAATSDDGVERRYLDTWWGRYLDDYECRDGEWRIIHRVCVHEVTKRDEITQPIPIDAHLFRQGSADRGVSG
ncbi:MAG: nuclear transport factor 2 family protein [Ilumatobacteraceae bacterium]